jgi:hypothetical protein
MFAGSLSGTFYAPPCFVLWPTPRPFKSSVVKLGRIDRVLAECRAPQTQSRRIGR